jgi:hypothetical protein
VTFLTTLGARKCWCWHCGALAEGVDGFELAHGVVDFGGGDFGDAGERRLGDDRRHGAAQLIGRREGQPAESGSDVGAEPAHTAPDPIFTLRPVGV